MVTEVKSDVIDCTDGRSCLLDAVRGLPRESLDLPNVIGEWSVRDCLSHLVGWDSWALNALERAADGFPIGPFPTEREINDSAPGDWRERPIEDLLAMLRDVRDQIAEHICQLTDDERNAPSMRVEDDLISVNGLVDALVEHDMEHAAQIRSWRKTQVVEGIAAG